MAFRFQYVGIALHDTSLDRRQAAFEAAAFGLSVGELSGPVSTDSGVHLILRLE